MSTPTVQCKHLIARQGFAGLMPLVLQLIVLGDHEA